MWFGLTWAKHSRLTHEGDGVQPFMGEEREHLILYTKKYIQYHSNVDVVIYGHRHIEVDLQLTKKARVIILGDWITQFSYVVWDGDHLLMQQYIEGESKL
jgi:UDP-2,3-diacylglucosamine hydrolase